MRTKITAIVTLIVLALPALAQPQIRQDHPRIFFNNEIWKEMEKNCQTGLKSRNLKRLIEKVDGFTDNPVAKNTGPVHTEDRYTPIGDITEFGYEAACCALVWRFTHEDKYLEKAKKMLRVSVDAYTEATKNLRPVGWYAHSRVNAFCAYDWIYEALTPEERKSYIVPLVQYVEDIQPENGLDIPRNNYGNTQSGFYGIRSLLWYSGLAAYGDGFCDDLAAKHLKIGYKENLEVLKYRNDTAGDDGALASMCPAYSLQHYPYAHFNFFYTMRSATGIEIAKEYPQMAYFPNWMWWVWIRDSQNPVSMRIPGQGDSYHHTNLIAAGRFWEHLSQYMEFFPDVDPDCYGITAALRGRIRNKNINMNVYPVLPFLIKDDFPPVEDYYNDMLDNSPVKARHFETLGLIHMRSAWTPDATYCTFTTGGVLDGHRHYDDNNFTIYKYDHLALDSGDRAQETDYNLVYYYSQSVAHNVVLVHKPGEKLPYHWGVTIKDDPVANENYGGMIEIGKSKTVAFETGDKFTYIASDATECYGPKVTSAVRQFVFVYPDYFIIYDRVDAADPSYKKEWLLHTKEKPLIKKNLMRADSGNGRLFCQTLLPQNALMNLVGGPGKEFWVRDRNYAIDPKVDEEYRKDAERRQRGPYMGSWRMEVKPQNEQKEDRFLNVLTAAYVDTVKPVTAKYLSDASRDGVELTIDGRKMIFWFNRKGEIGGEVQIGIDRRPLSTEVQKQKGFVVE